MIMSFILGAMIYCGFQIYFETIDSIINPVCSELTDYPLFVQAVSRIGNRSYDADLYNCYDFSKDLVQELEDAGIKSYIAIEKDRNHAWVVVPIEATTGKFVRPGEELEILELRDGEMNVICK